MRRLNQLRFSAAPAIMPGVMGSGIALSALVWICPAASAEMLSAWQFEPVTQQLTLTLPAGVMPQYTVTTAGDRLVLTLPNTQLGSVSTTATYDGPISQIQLTQAADAVEITLVLAPGTQLAPEQAQLVSVVSGGQTRWVLTPLIAQWAAPPSASQSSPTATAPTASNGMIVELPQLPADPNLNWPYTGVGRLSISAANLMLPSNLDTFNTLPETLAIDPFNLGLPEVEQVSVPSLEELDAAVGVALTSPNLVVPSLGAPPTGTATAVNPAPSATNNGVIVAPPPTEAAQPGAIAAVPTPATTPAAPAPAGSPGPTPMAVPNPNSATPQPTPSLPPSPSAATPTPVPTATIDQDNNGLAIAVSPVPVASDPVITSAPPNAEVAASALPVADNPVVSPLPAPSASATPIEPPFLTVPPPSSAPSSTPTLANNDVLAVPTVPTTTSTGVVIPPTLTAEPTPVAMAADNPIAFGQPLPAGEKANGDAFQPSWDDRQMAPDILIAAGTVLELRYTGPNSLALDPNTDLNEVLVLETEIRDPVTNGVLAPAGSQLIGQFEASGDGQQWVSQMLIVPSGQRIPFASTSEYVYNSPQLSGGGLALGTGLGVLALTLLTGFSGIGLLGGALIGATAAVGTAPQLLVIEPNQVIYAEVMQDIPRTMPIAAVPAQPQEWGGPGTWYTP